MMLLLDALAKIRHNSHYDIMNLKYALPWNWIKDAKALYRRFARDGI